MISELFESIEDIMNSDSYFEDRDFDELKVDILSLVSKDPELKDFLDSTFKKDFEDSENFTNFDIIKLIQNLSPDFEEDHDILKDLEGSIDIFFEDTDMDPEFFGTQELDFLNTFSSDSPEAKYIQVSESISKGNIIRLRRLKNKAQWKKDALKRAKYRASGKGRIEKIKRAKYMKKYARKNKTKLAKYRLEYKKKKLNK